MKRILTAALLMLATACGGGGHERTRLVVALTTSIEDTGLLDVLASAFAEAHPDIELSPVSVGTGQGIALAKQGDADVLLSHDSVAEAALVTQGLATERRSVMVNDFVIVGPAADPARASGNDARRALRAIADARALFISRGDDSGTHRRELKLWKAAGIDPKSVGGDWYVEAALGQGDALLLTGQKQGYMLTDRATYVKFRPRLDLTVLVEGDAALINSYGVTVMKGSRQAAADVFADWITSREAQLLIGNFGIAEYGQRLFTPTAIPPVP